MQTLRFFDRTIPVTNLISFKQSNQNQISKSRARHNDSANPNQIIQNRNTQAPPTAKISQKQDNLRDVIKSKIQIQKRNKTTTMNTEPIRDEKWHPQPDFDIDEIEELSDDDRLQYMTYAQAHPEFVATLDKLTDLWKFPNDRDSLTKKQAIEHARGLVCYNEELKEATRTRLAVFTRDISEQQCVLEAKRVIKIYEEKFTGMCTKTMEFIQASRGRVSSDDVADFMDTEVQPDGLFEDWLSDSGAF